MTNAFSLEPLCKPFAQMGASYCLPGSHDGDVRGALNATPRTYILKMRLQICL